MPVFMLELDLGVKGSLNTRLIERFFPGNQLDFINISPGFEKPITLAFQQIDPILDGQHVYHRYVFAIPKLKLAPIRLLTIWMSNLARVWEINYNGKLKTEFNIYQGNVITRDCRYDFDYLEDFGFDSKEFSAFMRRASPTYRDIQLR